MYENYFILGHWLFQWQVHSKNSDIIYHYSIYICNIMKVLESENRFDVNNRCWVCSYFQSVYKSYILFDLSYNLWGWRFIILRFYMWIKPVKYLYLTTLLCRLGWNTLISVTNLYMDMLSREFYRWNLYKVKKIVQSIINDLTQEKFKKHMDNVLDMIRV